MKFDQHYENYPAPIIAVTKDGYVAAKNLSANLIFDVVHVGAIASRYTDIAFDKEAMNMGKFCDKTCAYITLFDKMDGQEVTLLIISISTFCKDLFLNNPIESYKNKIVGSNTVGSDDKNLERRYIRAIHNNLIKANYFNTFSEIFNIDKSHLDDDDIIGYDTTNMASACTAVNNVAQNYLGDIKVTTDIEHTAGSLIADVNHKHMIGLMINTLSFCVINASDGINITLDSENNLAELSFSFESSSAFDRFIFNDDDSSLNASFALTVALEFAKLHDYKFSMSKEPKNKSFVYELTYYIPVKEINRIQISSRDDVGDCAKAMFLSVFFGK